MELICHRCFARFPAGVALFKCPRHAVVDPVLGAGAPLIFAGPEGRSGPSTQAPCPEHRLLTGLRVCPQCRRDLPAHAGRTPQAVIAVAGPRGAGKTVFVWSLLHQLRERLSRSPDPEVVAMFEDDGGFRAYAELSARILLAGELPEGTQAENQKLDGVAPVIVRLLRRPGRFRACPPVNLVLYDPAGELVESLDDVRYLRYLAHAEGLIYLVDGSTTDTSASDDGRASEGLSHIARQCREMLGLPADARLPQRLALTLTKADTFLGESPNPSSDNEAAVSQRCRERLRAAGQDNLLNIADRTFGEVRAFAVSALGRPPRDGRPDGRPEPVGVERPLLWLLSGTRT